MSIDIASELKRMSEEFNISEKEVLSFWRSGVRQLWGNSVFKQSFMNSKSMLVENTNSRSKKRFPKVRKYKCEICGGYFGSNEVELDHIESENSLKSYSDATSFIKTIMFTSPDKLQVLCKDKRKKGVGVVYTGCHSIKTFSERYNVSFEQAKVEKEFISIKKCKKQVDTLLSLGVSSSDIPKTKKAQEELLYNIMMEKFNNDTK